MRLLKLMFIDWLCISFVLLIITVLMQWAYIKGELGAVRIIPMPEGSEYEQIYPIMNPEEDEIHYY